MYVLHQNHVSRCNHIEQPEKHLIAVSKSIVIQMIQCSTFYDIHSIDLQFVTVKVINVSIDELWPKS